MTLPRVTIALLLLGTVLFGARRAHDEVTGSADIVTCARRVSEIGTGLLQGEVGAGLFGVDTLLRCHLRAETGELSEAQREACLAAETPLVTRRFSAMAAAQEDARRQLLAACSQLTVSELLATNGGLGFEAVVDFCEVGGIDDKSALATCVIQLVDRTAAELLVATKPRACEVLDASGLRDAFPELPCTEAPSATISRAGS